MKDSYANGAISSRLCTWAAAEELAAHYLGSDSASRPFETEQGVRWQSERRLPR